MGDFFTTLELAVSFPMALAVALTYTVKEIRAFGLILQRDRGTVYVEPARFLGLLWSIVWVLGYCLERVGS